MKSIIDGSIYAGQAINGVYNPPEELILGAGYRYGEENVPPVAEDYTRTYEAWVEDDGRNGRWVVVDRLTSEIEAEKYAAYVASCVPLFGAATLYRVALRRNFGDGAETNRDISQAYALAYFGQKVAAGTITPQETADSALMMALFPILSAATPDGTTWTFPWEAVP